MSGGDLLAGLLTGYPAAELAVGLALFALWHLRQVASLERWLRAGAKIKSMLSFTGIWDQLALCVYRIKKASASVYAERRERPAHQPG